MGNDKKQNTRVEQEDGRLWHGFNVSRLEDSAESLLKHIEVTQQQFTIAKSVLTNMLKRGTIQHFSTSEDPVKLADACEKVRESFSPFQQQIEAVQDAIVRWRNAERGSRRVRFEAAAREKNWMISGHWPEPVVSGIVFVVVDDVRDRATVNGRSVGGLPTAEKIVTQVEVELRELDKNRTEPEKFIKDLWNAYKAAGGRINEGVMVFELLRELLLLRQSKSFLRNPTSTHFHQYPVVQFRADLTGYLAAGTSPLRENAEEYILDIVGGSYAENGLFMYFPQSDRLGTCGRLTFRSIRT